MTSNSDLRSGKICPENFNPADFFIATLAVHPDHEEDSRAFINAICDDFEANEGQEVKVSVAENAVTKSGSGLFKEGKVTEQLCQDLKYE